MKENLGGRKLDHEYCISRMDIFEKCAYDALLNYKVDIND